jgi:hypothetical protein
MQKKIVKFPPQGKARKAQPVVGQTLLEEAMKRLPRGWTIRLYVERGFFYAYIDRLDGTVFNADMKMRLSVDEQFRLLIDSLPNITDDFSRADKFQSLEKGLAHISNPWKRPRWRG